MSPEVLLIGVVLGEYRNKTTRSRMVRVRASALGPVLGESGDEALVR